ncbi:uncharacterized protein LOC144468765 [Augochlora pura]
MMNFNRLCTAFLQVKNSKRGNVITRFCSSYFSRDQHSDPPKNAISRTHPDINIKFVPRTLNIDFGNLNNAIIKNIIEIPVKNIPSIEEPLTQCPVQRDLPLTNKILDLPTLENVVEKQAIRMIVIRRQKMKKHKRKKLRKRMKFQMESIRRRRNLQKEKIFQAELLAKIKEAEEFDPKEYVQQRLDLLLKERIPRAYGGEILPPNMVKQFLEEKKQKKEKRKNKFRLTLD